MLNFQTAVEEKIEEILFLKNFLVEEKNVILGLRVELQQSEALTLENEIENEDRLRIAIEDAEKNKIIYMKEEEEKREILIKEMTEKNLADRKIETEKREIEEKEKARRDKLQNVITNSNPGSGTFSDFLSKNQKEEKRIELEKQKNEEQDAFIKQQKNILFETEKLLKNAAEEKKESVALSFILSDDMQEQRR